MQHAALERWGRWAIAAVLGIAIGGCDSRERWSNDRAWFLLKTACQHPPVLGRLVDFPTVPTSQHEGKAPPCGSLDARFAAARLQRDADEAPVAETQRRAAVSRLVSGDIEGGISALKAALAISETDGLRSDLAAAYLTRANDSGSANDAVLALEEASRATSLNPGSPEALVNRSMALARLGLDADHEISREERVQRLATEALRAPLPPHELARDRDLMVEVVERHWLRSWSTAVIDNEATRAQEMQSALVRVANAISAAGGDASVAALVTELTSGPVDGLRRTYASAWLRYLSALEAWEADEVVLAERALRSINRSMTAAGPATGGRALLLQAMIDRVQGRTAAALRAVRSRSSSPAFERFPVLNGRRHWRLGLLLDEAGDLGAALTEYQNALQLLEQGGEREVGSIVSALLAGDYEEMEENDRAWNYQVRANRGVPFSRRVLRELIRTNAANLASVAGLHAAASALRTPAVEEARAAGSALGLAFLLADEAVDLHRQDRQHDALRTLEEAAHLVEVVPDAGSKDMVRALYAMTAGTVLSQSEPERAEKLLKEAVNIYRTRGNEFASADAQLERGRLLRKLGDITRAEPVFRDGLAITRRQEQSAKSTQEGAALRAARWELYQELADVQIDQDQPWAVLDMIEEARGLSNRANPRVRPAGAQAGPPRGTLLVSYVVLPSRVAAWALAPDYRTTFIIDIEPRALEDLVERHRNALRYRGDPAQEGDHLFDLLLGPIRSAIAASDRLVVITDGPLHGLPFATLRDPATKQLLVERTAVIMSPSLHYALEAQVQDSCEGCIDVVFGNPRSASSQGQGSLLPFSGEEATSIAEIYAGTAPVVGAEATRERLLRLLPSARMFHFAGHAIANASRPHLSRLVVSPSDADAEGAVFAADIEKLRLSARLAVLAACDTATGTVRPGTGMMGLARAFMTAGVPSVIATLWPVPDKEASQFFVQLHRELARGLDPANALRATQLELRAEGQGSATWGAVVAMGRTLHR